MERYTLFELHDTCKACRDWEKAIKLDGFTMSDSSNEYFAVYYKFCQKKTLKYIQQKN